MVFVQHSLLEEEDNNLILTISVLDYKSFYESKLKASVPGISKCRSVKFTRFGKPALRKTMSGDYTPFVLYKVGIPRYNTQRELRPAYNSCIKLKDKKLENIKHLIGFIEKEENKKLNMCYGMLQ